MNAIEFVKKYGLVNATKWCVTQAPASADYYNITGGYVRKVNKKGWISSENCVCIIEVKQIVDAYELVEAWGGIDRTKDRIEWAIVNKNYYAADMMKHSINLVEQCQND